jgi:hypothetical protein
MAFSIALISDSVKAPLFLIFAELSLIALIPALIGQIVPGSGQHAANISRFNQPTPSCGL